MLLDKNEAYLQFLTLAVFESNLSVHLYECVSAQLLIPLLEQYGGFDIDDDWCKLLSNI